MNENVCRLCLQTITENCQPIEKCLKDILKLNLNISKSAVKCTECTSNLEVFLKFKSACEYMTEETLSTGFKEDIDVHMKNIEITNNLLSLTESKKEARCTFCTKFKESESLTSINETKQHMFLVDVLKEYIPKLNLNIREELLTCETCLVGLQSVSSFVLKCLDVEQKINKYIEMKGTDDKGQIELKDVQQFMFNSTVKLEIKSEDVNDFLRGKCDPLQENHSMETQAEIKYEINMENLKVIIKTEESNQSDYERFLECSTLTESDNGSSDVSVSKPQRCIDQHDVTNEGTSDISIFQCDLCTYTSKSKHNLSRHKLFHKNASETAMFKCEVCPYETKHLSCIKQHILIHKNTSEVTMFKCELCLFESKHLRGLRRHRLTHKSASEIPMFKCKMCSFKTKHKDSLKRHIMNHETQEGDNASEISMYQCHLCSYEAKHKYYLDRHMLVHKSSSSVTMFKCDMCAFETKRKYTLTQHVLTHKCTTEIPMFKCELCPFETKYKMSLVRHKSNHKSTTMRPDELV